METRILKQVKMFDIKAYGQTLSGHGYTDTIPTLTWAEEQIWESDDKCQLLLNNAIAEWQDKQKKNPWNTPLKQPELMVYWQTVKIFND